MIMKFLINNVLIASDHAGFTLKQYLVNELSCDTNLCIKDLGSHSEDLVDYPDFAKELCNEMTVNTFGILICGSGIGMSIAANRFKKVRAALCYSNAMVKLARQHNDANVLVLGSRFITNKQALEMTNTFLSIRFEGCRHSNRINKL